MTAEVLAVGHYTVARYLENPFHKDPLLYTIVFAPLTFSIPHYQQFLDLHYLMVSLREISFLWFIVYIIFKISFFLCFEDIKAI